MGIKISYKDETENMHQQQICLKIMLNCCSLSIHLIHFTDTLEHKNV